MKTNQDTRKNILKELVERGKAKGMLTYKEIMDAFEEIELAPEQIEKVYETIENLGVEVVDDIDPDLEELTEEDRSTACGKCLNKQRDEFGKTN